MTIMPQFIDVHASRPISQHRIFWPGVMGYENAQGADLTRFPSLACIKARKAESPPQPLDVFTADVRNARDRVLVLDENLFKPEGNNASAQWDRIFQVLAWFPQSFTAKDVRILTGSVNKDGVDAMIEDELLKHSREISVQPNGPSTEIKVRFTLRKTFPYVHDRFAVIDDELWHFGATVGGLHSKVSAATRGWSAIDHHAVAFFDQAWAGDSDFLESPSKRSRRKA